jgi:hypothetical protein
MTTVTIDIDLGELDEDNLIEELETRGYITFTISELSELRMLLDTMQPDIGTNLYFLRDKLINSE